MSTTTTPAEHRRRAEILRAINDGIDHRALPSVWEVFADEADLLRSAQQFWQRHLATALDSALETGGGTLIDDVSAAYAATAARFPHLRRLLDEHRDHPAVARGVRQEDTWLEQAAGQPAEDVIELASVLGIREASPTGSPARVWRFARGVFGPSAARRSVEASS